MPSANTQDISVLIVGALLPSLQQAIEASYDATRYWELDEPQAWLAANGNRVRAIITSGGWGASADLIGQLPNLEGIFSFGVGYDSIAVDVARARGVVVTNTPNVLDECVADTAMALILDSLRRLSEAERYVRAGKWAAARFPLATKVGGKRLGVVGLGNIGRAIAIRAQAFGMQIAYHNRNPRAGIDYLYFADLDALIEHSDVLVLAVPGGKATDKLIDARRLALLGGKGYLVNIARGSVVDQPALIHALENGVIAGAGLDVLDGEPQVPDRLLALENLVLLPHLASGTVETREAMGALVWDNLQGWFTGNKRVLTPVE
ncbi:2-hydroxyacid dehydrogenase [Pseudomonas sp. NPDC089401]|uniref:2-hydroxyacid dehydrogenase n=1 Tax=Pseudomonas sp. NPDC089401 TaxID=3364462 RepID=UPI003828730D